MMLSLNLILAMYGVVGVGVLLLTMISKSHKTMNALSIILPSAYLILTFLALHTPQFHLTR